MCCLVERVTRIINSQSGGSVPSLVLSFVFDLRPEFPKYDLDPFYQRFLIHTVEENKGSAKRNN